MDKMIVSFENPDSLETWYSVNDGVMGGRSTGAFVGTKAGSLLFFGDLSLENNGGFASIRSRMESLDLSGSEGLLVRLKGDGRSYIMNLWGPRMGSATSYRASMPTKEGEVEEVFIPFSEFRLTSFGRRVRGPALDTSNIRSLGFTLSDKKEGPFKLEILSIQSVAGELAGPAPTVSASELILLAIERGVPLFNEGSPGGCRAVYELACQALLGLPEVPEAARKDLSNSLRQMRNSPDEAERAWILRYALDRTLVELNQSS